MRNNGKGEEEYLKMTSSLFLGKFMPVRIFSVSPELLRWST